jgi:hypothetical protein
VSGVSNLSRGQAIAGIGGALLVISLFLTWVSFGSIASQSAFDAFSVMDIIMLIVGLAAVAYALADAVEGAPGLPAGLPWILSVVAVVVFGWALGWDLEVPNAGVGAWIALLASAAIAYGSFTSAPATSRGTRRGPPAPTAVQPPVPPVPPSP